MNCTNKRIIGFWHYGVILTYASTVLAVISICFSALGRAGEAVVCLLFSGLCDGFDGAVARTRKNRTPSDKMFGIQIDSLSDLMAFGIAPVMVGFAMGLTAWYYVALYCAYVLCALIRLGYFNVSEIERQQNPELEKGAHFEGVPVTEIALVLPIFYFVSTMTDIALVAQICMAVLYFVYGMLMILRFPVPKPRSRNLIIMIVCFLAVIAGLFLVRWFVCGVHTL